MTRQQSVCSTVVYTDNENSHRRHSLNVNTLHTLCPCWNKRSRKFPGKTADSRVVEPLAQQLSASSSRSISYLRSRQGVPGANIQRVLLIGGPHTKPLPRRGATRMQHQLKPNSRSLFISTSLRLKQRLLSTTETEIS